MRILIWFRADLRLHDHAPLQAALKSDAQVVPVYCFDPRQFGQTPFGFAKTGAFRAQFLQESILNLRHSLQSLGNNLMLRQGYPEQVIPELAQTLDCDAVYFHQEATSEEIRVEKALKQALDAQGIGHRSFWGHTLHGVDDLPFAIAQLPELFTQFRKGVEAKSMICVPLPTPERLPPFPAFKPDIELGQCPTLDDFGLTEPVPDPRATIGFRGGETAGLSRLQTYIWERDRLKVYKQTRNGMLHPDDSSKLSPWLALGCLSPRLIQAEVQRYETERVKNDSTYWLTFELLWRDYFRWICVKHGDRLFKVSGLRGLTLPWGQNTQLFTLWQEGKTGYPLVDASMRELAATGYMSNRGRQNVASFLTKNLGLNWQMGAEWFESQLIDYDVCSNWGNWNYTAGVGNDARGFRFFNIVKQSKDYDPQGEYVKHWLGELASVPGDKVHTPWQLLPVEQKRFGVEMGKDYPAPIVDLLRSAQEQERLYNKAFKNQGF
jgi:deoxyribodipyrimidine photo-lyase